MKNNIRKRKLCLSSVLTLALINSFTLLQAQSAKKLIADLQAIHTSVRSLPCNSGQLISNRAMNLFLAEKIGTYLTGYKSISFYKNNITADVLNGTFSLSHNLFQPSGIDKPITSFLVVGVKANVSNTLPSISNRKTFSNDLGATIKKVWIATPKTTTNTCLDKNIMDIKRASIINLLTKEIEEADKAFLQSLAEIPQDTISASDFDQSKKILQEDFYANLREEFSRKFAALQYEELASQKRYKRVSTHWTSVDVYAPIILKRFVVAEALNVFSRNKKAYAFEGAVSHTRFLESKKVGRLFITIEAKAYLNNAADSRLLEYINYHDYKNLGGIDTSSLQQRKISSLFIGHYKTFVTPAAKFQVAYFPPESHIGISSSIEQHFGTFKTIDWILGIPVVLINKIGSPAANFEFQLQYLDLAHHLFPNRTFRDNISINLTVGIPFSKVIF